jgi:putative oxidoreductase
MPASKSGSTAGYLRSVMRIVLAFTFTCHGLQKVFGLLGGMDHQGAKAALSSLPWVGGVLELVGGLLLLGGLLTRPVAFVLCGEMAYAYFFIHGKRGGLPIQNGGELAVVYCFVFLYLVAAGAGPISLDRLLRRST